jgi:MoxR-like ATPase
MQEQQLLTWEQVEAVLRGSRLTLLYGPPGTGKTTAAVNAARDLGVSCFSVNLADEMPSAEIRGHFIPKGTVWDWMNGPALTPYRDGGVLVLNEIDKASDDVLDFCHNLMDDRGVSRITLPSGEIVFPSDAFRIVCTTNEDPGFIRSRSGAVADRLSNAIYIGTPHPDAIAALPEDLRDAAENTATTDTHPDRPATLRRWQAFATLRDAVETDVAGLAVFGNRWQEIQDALTLAASR